MFFWRFQLLGILIAKAWPSVGNLSKAVSRILTERKNQKAMAATDEQNEPEEKNQESAPVPAPAPVKRVGCRIRAEVVYAKKS